MGVFYFLNSGAFVPEAAPPIASPSPVVTPVLGVQNNGESYQVSRVIDGDTIEVVMNGKIEKVRLIGIDTPETVDPRRSTECFGKAASDFTKQLLASSSVQLQKDVSERDRYGRLLRYVYKDGVFINELLVREGFAQASAYPPDITLQPQLKQAQAEAQAAERGLWAPGACP